MGDTNQEILDQLVKCKVKNFVNREGEVSPFSSDRIYEAVKRSNEVTRELSLEQILEVTNKMIKVINYKYPNEKNIYIEKIQDIVEQELATTGFYETAKSYILYRNKRDSQRFGKKTIVDAEDTIDDYLKNLDWRIKENSNIGYSIGGLIISNSGKLSANYWLSNVYPDEVGEAHRQGDFHIHDLYMLTGYCAGWSLRMLLEEGFNGVPGFVQAKAPKHLSAATGQMVNFFGTLQNEWGGAQAFSSLDTYLAPFIRLDNLTYKQVKQELQQLVFNLNVPSRWGTQTPFTNFTFDWVCPDDLKAKHPKIQGKEVDFTYGDLQVEMDMINKAYIETMTEGDAMGQPFTFPIPTYNITHDFIWDSENADLLFEMTSKFGIPYFQNFLNSDLDPSDVRSMCCRLQMDLKELRKRGGGLFGSAEQTGSIGIVTLNCARLGYLYKGNKEQLFYKLDHLLELIKNSLEIKRKTITRYLEGGLYPFTKRYLGTYRNFFSTVGVNGMHEMIRNFTGDTEDITTEKGIEFAVEFMDHIRAKMVDFQEETGNLYNLEATPAEGTTYRFAKEDAKRYDDILQAGTKEAPYYTNSSQVPVGYTDDPFEVLDLQSELQTKYTGGTVQHLYMSERISSIEACKKIVKKALSNYRLPYISITPTFSICPKHGYLAGEQEYCSKCDEELKQVKMAKAREELE